MDAMHTPQSPIPPFALERFFARWEFVATHSLCSSDVEGYPMRDLLALADGETCALWESLSLGYTETQGLPLLRNEIASLYERVDANDVLTFAGAEEAVYVAMRTLLRAGDHIIVTWPGYQSLYQIAQSMGVDVTLIALTPAPMGTFRLSQRERGHWRIDPQTIRAALKPNTKMIVTNFPHNPTGALPSHADWQALLDVARDAGCWFFSDEVYRWSEYDAADRLPAAADCYDKALSLGVMSKSFALAGLRIGWLATKDASALAALRHYKDYTSLCNSAPSEVLALIALRAKETVLARSRRMIQSNFTLVESFMQRHTDRFAWIAPRAGSIAFPQLLGDRSIDEFVDALVRKEGVLLLPGSMYGYSGNHFRIGLGRANLPEALKRLEAFLQTENAER
jgi:aspartate/methionine/tyrosine aminotransferase